MREYLEAGERELEIEREKELWSCGGGERDGEGERELSRHSVDCGGPEEERQSVE